MLMVSQAQIYTGQRLDWFAAKYTYLLKSGELSPERDLELRNELLSEFYPIGRSFAKRRSSRLPVSIQLEDLVQEGMLGIIKSLGNFDIRKGHFLGWAARRFDGAMLDYVRDIDTIPRLDRLREAQMETYRQEFYTQNKRFPNESESEDFWKKIKGDRGEINYSQFKERLDKFPNVGFQDVLLNSDSRKGPRYLSEFIEARKSEAEEQLIAREVREKLMSVLNGQLNERERKVIDLYHKGLKMWEIGEALGVKESRICQIYNGVIKRLRKKFEGELLIS